MITVNSPLQAAVMLLKLKAEIIFKHQSQTEFCLATGIREDRLSRIIRERIKPSAREKTLICEALNCQDDIFQNGITQ